MNPEKYFDNYDFTSIVEQILKENDIQSDDNHYQRHMQEIRTKIEAIRRNYKTKDYFKEIPILDNDFSSYVISNISYNHFHSNKHAFRRRSQKRKIQNISKS